MLKSSFVNSYRTLTPPWGFSGLGYIVYKRTYARRVEGEDRTEEWWETCRRVVDGVQALGARYTEDEAEHLFNAMFFLKCTFAGRGLWQLGTDNNTRLGGDSLVNCWMTELTRPNDFSFLFDELMLGGGVGFTVRRMDVGRLPRVMGKGLVTHLDAKDADFIVPDKREGWVGLLRRVMKAYLETGRPFTYSTLLVRGRGEPIATFGGTASGPGILVSGIDQICKIMDARAGNRLSTVDVLDIANIIGSTVVAGNVRRSAEIAIGDPDDLAYLRAKRWDLGHIPGHRAMSNNTVEVSTLDDLPDEFWKGYLGHGEPYGLFNRLTSQRYGRIGENRPDMSIIGMNPCGEIGLADKEPCNLAELFLPNISSQVELNDLARLLYKGQKAIAAMEYRYPETNDIVHENMRLGLSVSGIMQATNKLPWLSTCYSQLREFDTEWSKKLGVKPSVRLTTVKPSGTVSLLAGVTPGIHPGYSRYHIRRVRMSVDDKLVEYCRSRGLPVEAARTLAGDVDPNTSIVEFPCAFDPKTILAGQVHAVDQLEYLRDVQRVWADNSVSCTVYYRKSELAEIRTYLKAHWSELKSVSFLLHSEHGFDQAPLEEIDADEYEDRVARVGEVGSAGFDTYTQDIDTDCDGGACAIR